MTLREAGAVGAEVQTSGPGPAAHALKTGRPRSSRADEAIIEAVLDLLSEGVTVDSISIEAVAARAGVGKATIYRRWSTKQEMLVDALRALKGPHPQPRGSNVRERILSLLKMAGKGHDARVARIFPCLMPEVMRSGIAYGIWQEVMVRPRRETFREVLRQAVAEGEVREDLDIEVALAVLSGPILMNRLLKWNPDLDDDTLPERVVDMVLGGIAAR